MTSTHNLPPALLYTIFCCHAHIEMSREQVHLRKRPVTIQQNIRHGLFWSVDVGVTILFGAKQTLRGRGGAKQANWLWKDAL